MACNCCRSIDLKRTISEERTPHHSTFAELQDCASIGDCLACVWVRDALISIFKKKGEESCVYNVAKISCYVEKKCGIAILWFQAKIGYMDYSKGIDVFVPQGSPLADSGIIIGRPVAPFADDASCFELAREWRDTCLREHGETCPSSTEQTLPTRVIDVGPSAGSQEPILRLTNGERGEWVALSHCWGTLSRFVTDSSNVPVSERSINLGDMPPTFRDAVIVIRELGYRYLWIDSLCIIQDIHEDWVTESARMRDYYKYATLTISSDSSPGDHVGFLKHHREVPERFTFTLASGEEISVRPMIRYLGITDRNSFVAQRAWTLQEFALAPRSLLYTSHQIIWKCVTDDYWEYRANIREEQGVFAHSIKRFFSTVCSGKERFPLQKQFLDHSFQWYSLSSDYFLRDLTNKNDVLPAISGLAKEIQNQNGKTYAAGILVEEIYIGLVWSTCGNGKMPEAYQAPSWSWASLERLPRDAARVRTCYPHHALYDKRKFYHAQLIERRANCLSYEIALEDNDPFGRVKSGCIRLYGRLLPLRFWNGTTKSHSHPSKYWHQSHLHHDLEDSDKLICYFDTIPWDIKEENAEEGVSF